MSLHHRTAKTIFQNALPRYMRAASCKSRHYTQLDRRVALTLPYIQHNSRNLVVGLTIDIDHGDAAERFFDAAGAYFPFPNFYIVTPENGHLQARFQLKDPVSKSSLSRQSPLAYLAAIQYGINRLVGGDPAYTNYIMKNPLHEKWQPTTTWINEEPFSLDQLASNLPRKPSGALLTPETRKTAAGTRALPNESRNCWLFQDAASFSYRTVSSYRDRQDQQGFTRRMDQYIEARNRELQNPLPPAEIRSIHRSVTGWTWKNYHPSEAAARKNRGVMGLDSVGTDLSLSEKQALSAARTNQIQKNATEQRIIQAIGELTAQGKRVSKAAVARIVGISDRALRKDYSRFFM